MKEHPYMEKLGRFTAYARTQRFARNAPYAAVFPLENLLHFADRRDESIIVSYCTSAEVPFGCSKGTPGGRSPLKKGAAAWWQRPLGAI